MKLYNTPTKKIEEFIPIDDGKVGLYACGFTVYDFTHLGHLRKYTMDDVLIRTLKHEGYDVNFIQNITDVGHLASDEDTGEDKLEKGAKKYGKSVWDVAKEFEDYFFRSMDLMGNLRPDKSTRATEHIEEQLNLVKTLKEKGYTYVIDGDGVYFDTSKFPEYGKMAGLDLKRQQEGARVEKVVGKRNSSDFALWKFEREGENRAMIWESPWSKRSFPGWHVECSAMSMKYLGEQFDIHTGGIDHIPVHHTNEIAQSEAATGKSPFVKYWVHHNFLKVDGTKMSKSLGNFYTIDDVMERGFSPRALRLLFMTAHYQSEMNFTWENLVGMQKSYERLLKIVVDLKKNVLESEKTDEKLVADFDGNLATKFKDKFFTALSENLNTAQALAVLWEVMKSDELSNSEKLSLLLAFDEVFQLDLKQAEQVLEKIKFNKLGDTTGNFSGEMNDLPEEIQQILLDRETARKNNDWGQSDALRDLLLKKGYKVLDSSEGQKLEKLHF
ncbi:MAG: cysteine--tRNA ligase [Candidatus Pacebacteria bacterium CG_4_10_14_3_um_filter_34_15]|nr:cysteine--tRNA ligase [Candidatus Pacearchaeota archaeon]NCQ65407.1 cysteine--tRNA ligase [Candidatus Paceibacterota bacterium]OIO44214.1 MAG: cysteine--tRNA ligase [Candidatus Pacebacteria bacterium CG1_02_43_31]PIQ80790.1 MAG: cysteine--tRNA ligase [Candidatus Pacebacteria bacterium CG11_big_fil_rev_8_21_14_0_20_34_55]PIX81401.1 MAG: cysteine--tRNA ligase [Candidatus Pacebacteria bacterium CG_4_10_14_3_um_filter_34_15]PJC43870.1 MAG: cysteine--tRNA ligase [Candidatus Pacebacteria bacteriu